ncbi:MAG: peptidase T [Brevinema sp.]
MPYTEYLKNSFLRYTAIESQSNDKIAALPSTDGQKQMIQQIHADLTDLGVKNITVNENHVLIAYFKGTIPAPAIGFMAHVDTVDIGASAKVNARLHHYDGVDIPLNTEISLKSSDYPELSRYQGQDIFVTDGTSVLGADDKAGVAVLTALAKFLIEENHPHGDIYLIYVPDEEIGLKGAYSLDPTSIPIEFCYTVDGSEIGQFGAETFNAAGFDITFEGVSIHPGTAKGVLVNPILMAQHFIEQFPTEETPEKTEERQGYYWMHNLSADPMKAVLEMSIRDFDINLFNNRKSFVNNALDNTRKAFPTGKITSKMEDQYSNIASSMGDDKRCISLAEAAFAQAKVPMKSEVIRGGTDGSVLSAKGIPTPNIFTGGHNAHSIYEFLPLPSLVKAFDVCSYIVRLASQYQK